IRDTLTANGWRIDFLGPTTYLANTSSMAGDPNNLPAQMRQQMSPEQVELMKKTRERFAAIVPLLDDDRVHLPFTVVHAVRVD
ncbi:MAG TPA: class I SAM-dependent methyltransferase, partial [Mycobacterium sp.]